MKPQFNFCKLSTSCKIESEITVIALATEQVSHSYPRGCDHVCYSCLVSYVVCP